MPLKPTVGVPDRGKQAVTVTELGHLASGVGHHVINAFSAIVSNAEILRLKLAMPDPPDPSAMADAIIRTAVEAAAVARRLIDVSRPLTGIGDDTVALDRLVEDYAAARASEGAGSIRWTAKTAPTPPIQGNADLIRAVLDNLTANAIDAAGPGELQIDLSTSIDARGWIVLDIRDNGLGMSPEVLERAVEPFFSTKAGHIGVGLSIANGIWRRHKGTLAVRSSGGDGTTIRLCIEPIRPPG